jgi:uncharacterized membrane protein YphA (DoxX/SURF4 family)
MPDLRSTMSAVLAIGRILFALIFINSGISHLTKLEAMTGYAKYKKVPAAKLSVIVSGLMILVGGIYVALGIYADLGALLIAIFLILTALIMHTFWKETDPTAKQNASISFFKDISLAGAALMIFVMVGSGADFGWHITSAFFNFK